MRALATNTLYLADDVDEMVEEDRLEDLDQALAANAMWMARLAIALDEARERRQELLSGAKELRRRRARNILDAYIAPLRFFSIEEVKDSASYNFSEALLPESLQERTNER